MPRRTALRLLTAAGAALAAGGCGLLGGNRYRFRLTVAVATPEGLRTGSSVYEVWASRTGAFLPDAAKRTWQVTGEAVAVDLPGGRTLYALLKTGAHFDDMMGLSMNTLHPDFRGTGYDVVGVAEELARGEHPGPAPVAPADYPMLVTFADESDPASVQLVEPENFAVQFGPGVRLQHITAELTEDAVTRGIEAKLRWLSDYPEPRVDPTYKGSVSPTAEQLLKHGDFRRGTK